MTRTAQVGAVDGTGPGYRSFWLWDALVAVSTVLTCVLIAVEVERPVPARVGAAALVLVIALAWPAGVRRMALTNHDRQLRPARVAASLGLSAALVAAIALADSANWAAFVAYTQLFWLLPLTWAIGAVVVLTFAGPLAAALVRAEAVSVDIVPPQAVFMTLFGVLVAVFITRLAHESGRRAGLIAELEASQAEVAGLSRVAGAAAERERLAGEIHDTLAQGFTSVVTLLQAAQAQFDADPDAARRHVELAVRAARENLGEARRLVAATAPGDLADRSLADAVERAADRFAEEAAVPTEHTATGPPRRLPAESEIVLLRAAQELLANVRRHAGATRVRVELDYTRPDAVSLTVTDDGRGFDPAAVGEDSYGLRLLRTRVERLDGTVDVRSGAGGCAVAVRLPTPVPQEVR
jgi:signal transduction histidine kinase